MESDLKANSQLGAIPPFVEYFPQLHTNDQPFSHPQGDYFLEKQPPFDFFTTTHLPKLHSDDSSSVMLPLLGYPHHQTLDSHSTAAPPKSKKRSRATRQQRQNMSDKIWSLQKIAPFDTKMNIASHLEETYKYVKFLQAQVRAFQFMPCTSSSSSSFCSGGQVFGGGGEFGTLGMLSRQQVLEVLLNSRAVQTKLYKEGWCVYSVEQLVALKKMGAF